MVRYIEDIEKHYHVLKLNYTGVSSGTFVASIYGLDKSIFNAKLKNKGLYSKKVNIHTNTLFHTRFINSFDDMEDMI